MEFDIKQDCIGVNWQAVADTLRSVGMAYHDLGIHQRAFEASHTTIFVYHEDNLIGFGRAISDGEYQAAIYDCAVLKDYQGKGLGSLIMKNILTRVSHCNVILYASPGKEVFYQKHQFRRMKTGMALFTDREAKIERGFTE
jgi:GNAT superfamily N-acetyltransferase